MGVFLWTRYPYKPRTLQAKLEKEVKKGRERALGKLITIRTLMKSRIENQSAATMTLAFIFTLCLNPAPYKVTSLIRKRPPP